MPTPFPKPTPPQDTTQLMQRARRLAGHTLGELAQQLRCQVPADLRRHKGWVGQLLERCLGASGGNLPQPDFAHLGIELKTLPIDHRGKPLQSTYVTTVPLKDLGNQQWRLSSVWRKLSHVLWLPILAENQLAVHQRVIGQPILWQPSAAEEDLLHRDWSFHLQKIRAGNIADICGGSGRVLQIRPKAAHGDTLAQVEADSGAQLTGPRGFYLRPIFTEYIIQCYFYGEWRCLEKGDSELF